MSAILYVDYDYDEVLQELIEEMVQIATEEEEYTLNSCKD